MKEAKTGLVDTMESIRSFLAFDIESETVMNRLRDVQALLIKTGADLKAVEPKNIHITVRFLGNVSENTVEKLHDCMKKVQFVPFDVKIHGVGAFPDAKHPRVVWAGITQGANELRSVFDQLEPQLQSLGFAAEPRGFNPHLTIARVRSGRNRAELTKSIGDNKDCEFGVVHAKCLRLKKSVLTPKGPIYSTLKEHCPPS